MGIKIDPETGLIITLADDGGGGADTSDATATAGDVSAGVTFYGAEGKATGTMPDVTATANGNKVTVPAGRIRTAQTVTVGTAKAASTIMPGITDKTIPAGAYLAGAQTIKGDANLLPENIAKGKTIFNVEGTIAPPDFFKCVEVIKKDIDRYYYYPINDPSSKIELTYLGNESGVKIVEYASIDPETSGYIMESREIQCSWDVYTDGSARYVDFTDPTHLLGDIFMHHDQDRYMSNFYYDQHGNLVFDEVGQYHAVGYIPFKETEKIRLWSGNKAVLTDGAYTFEEAITEGLTFGNGYTPVVGGVYDATALIQVTRMFDGILLPQDGLLVCAVPDSTWKDGQSLSTWGNFTQPDTSKQPVIRSMDGVTGISVVTGSEMTAQSTAITDDFTYVCKFYVNGNQSATQGTFAFMRDNSWLGAVAGFGDGAGNLYAILSRHGENQTVSTLDLATVNKGQHTLVITYEKSSGTAKFYLDGVLCSTRSYSPGFSHSNTFYYAQETTADYALILGLAVYNRVVSDAEIYEQFIW